MFYVFMFFDGGKRRPHIRDCRVLLMFYVFMFFDGGKDVRT